MQRATQDRRRRVQRIAVIDPVGNYGGATRFVRALLPALQRARPDLRTTFFANGDSVRRDGIAEDLTASGIVVRELMSVRSVPWKSRPLSWRAWYKLRRSLWPAGLVSPDDVAANLAREIPSLVRDSDVAYFPWPYGMAMPSVGCAMVTTIHDLNFRYFFGTPLFSRADALTLDDQIGHWLQGARTVTSSQFMAKEFARFYPSSRAVAVIGLAAFSIPPGAAQPETAIGGGVLAIPRPYILCPTHLTVHKNIGPLIAAQALLRRKYPALRLAFTGNGTEVVTGQATAVGTIRGVPDADVIGLGYVSNEEIDALIEGASVVVNPSLYEATNGPGLDAWSRGTPVAMSRIPPFLEHLTSLRVEAALFDPRDPDDIAAKIADILDRPDHWAEVAARSKTAVGSRTWADVATEYLEVFDSAFRQFAEA
jgi:glycosyltransferase involved in cell wall biosynthesis